MVIRYAAGCLVLLVLLGAGCAHLDEGRVPLPEVQVSQVTPVAISFHELTLRVELDVTNPYRTGLPIQSVGAEFLIEGNRVFSSLSDDDFVIPASSSSSQSFTVVLPFAALSESVVAYREREMLDAQIEMRIQVALPELPGLPGSYTFELSDQIQIPTLDPRIRIAGFRVQPPSADQIARAVESAALETGIDQAVGFFPACCVDRRHRSNSTHARLMCRL